MTTVLDTSPPEFIIGYDNANKVKFLQVHSYASPACLAKVV